MKDDEIKREEVSRIWRKLLKIIGYFIYFIFMINH
jgi:hypothetical protein